MKVNIFKQLTSLTFDVQKFHVSPVRVRTQIVSHLYFALQGVGSDAFQKYQQTTNN